MIYILDAYNVIHKLKLFESSLQKDLRSARESLVSTASAWATQRGDIQKIILVFDGKTEFHGLYPTRNVKVESIFSDTGQPADEKIVEILEQLGSKNQKCVVSDDNFVRNHSRAYQTPSLSVHEFYSIMTRTKQVNGQSSKGSTKTAFNEKKISEHQANDITYYYKKQLGL